MLERINLVPQISLAGRVKKLVPWICGLFLVIGALALLVMGRQLDKDNKILQGEIALLQKQDAGRQEQQLLLARLNGTVKKMQDEELQLRKVVATLDEVGKKKRNYSELLLGVAEILPSTVRCEKIVLGEKKGSISGKATVYRDLPAFIQNLGKIKGLHSVFLEEVNQSEEEGEAGILAFDIVFGLR